MRIVEIGDCSMVIMKDSEDPPWVSVGNIYRKAIRRGHKYSIGVASESSSEATVTSDYICTAGRLIMFFKDNINSKFHLHDKVSLELLGVGRG